MRRMLYAQVCVIAVLLAGGCAALPKAEKVKAFGAAVDSSAGILGDALSTNRVIAVRTSQERQAVAYIQGGRVRLDEADVDLGAIISAPEQVAMLDALQAYGKALELAADQGVIDELEKASVRLGEAAGDMVVAASPVASPVAGPALKVAGRLLGFSLGNAYAAEITSVIRARDPAVQKVTSLLVNDLEGIVSLIDIQVLNFDIKRQESLIAVRADRRVDRLALYKEHMVARADLDTIKVKQAALSNFKTILEKMAATHHALATNQVDTAKLIADFVALSSDMRDVLKAVNASTKR